MGVGSDRIETMNGKEPSGRVIGAFVDDTENRRRDQRPWLRNVQLQPQSSCSIQIPSDGVCEQRMEVSDGVSR